MEEGSVTEGLYRVVSQLNEAASAEEPMLGEDLVREIVVRRARGEGVKRIARELATSQPRRPSVRVAAPLCGSTRRILMLLHFLQLRGTTSSGTGQP